MDMRKSACESESGCESVLMRVCVKFHKILRACVCVHGLKSGQVKSMGV